MKILNKKLFVHPGDPGMVAICSNASVKTDGRLTMARPSAQKVLSFMPDIDQVCGAQVREVGQDYFFLPVKLPADGKAGFGLFQVRRKWTDPLDAKLIEQAVVSFGTFARLKPKWHFHLEYPEGHGIGEEAMGVLLEPLPDNVIVCLTGERRKISQRSVREIYDEVARFLRQRQGDRAVAFLKELNWPDPEGQVDAARQTLDL
jgi:hypothetical protein